MGLLEPADIIQNRLTQAYATLDLIYTMTVNRQHSQELIESLREGTIGDAVHGAMLRIEEALAANAQEVSRG